MTALSLTRKIIHSHLVAGDANPGESITLRIDQVLLQDTNGPMSFMQLEAMGVELLKVPRVVAYIDHNILQVDYRNTDDHRYLESVCARYGAIVSKAGNGICHQVHLESYSVPGETLVGTDSHTVLGGAVGMFALGGGSMQVALALREGHYSLTMPKVIRVRLSGALRPHVSAKDVALELLRRISVKGGRGSVFEYTGPGVAELSIPQRATIANMAAELGLTTALFPADAVTRAYFEALGRADEWAPLRADEDASYDGELEIDLGEIGVQVAVPSSPDNVVGVEVLAGTPIDQVIVGSCTNGSWEDMQTVAELLRGRQVHPDLSVVVFPGSRRVLEAMAREGLLAQLLSAGVQVASPSCGACAGLSHVPASGTKTLRTFNRNFPGRSGNRHDRVYLCSPEVAAASALAGVISDPRELGREPSTRALPRSLKASPGGVVDHARTDPARRRLEIIRGPNIKPVPLGSPPPDTLRATIVLTAGDNISTDHISPIGVEALRLRTNVPAIATHSFKHHDPEFVARARAGAPGVIVAGENFGQGSSRETAVSGLMVLGVRAIIAGSFARIYRANMLNWGLIPLCVSSVDDREALRQGAALELPELRRSLARGEPIRVRVASTGAQLLATCSLNAEERALLLAGGVLARAAAMTHTTPQQETRDR